MFHQTPSIGSTTLLPPATIVVDHGQATCATFPAWRSAGPTTAFWNCITLNDVGADQPTGQREGWRRQSLYAPEEPTWVALAFETFSSRRRVPDYWPLRTRLDSASRFQGSAWLATSSAPRGRTIGAGYVRA